MTATTAIEQRILLLDRPMFVRAEPEHLDAQRSGLVLCGKAASSSVRRLREDGYEGVLLADPAAYEKEEASPEKPCSIEDMRLFGGGIDSTLDEQLDCGATVAVTPTRYIRAGALDALAGLTRAVRSLERSVVVVAVPVAVEWLDGERFAQLIEQLQRIPHPKALILGGQRDPLAGRRARPRALRRLVGQVAGVGLWRTDLAAFDCLAYGGLFAAIGAGGSLRHLVPPKERIAARPGAHYPSVLMPDLLHFSTAGQLARKYAERVPPRCWCPVCEDDSLGRFNSLSGEVRAEAHAHNAACWNGWLPDLFFHTALGDRQAWWRNRCRAAVDEHDRESRRIGQPGAFKPPAPLRAWAELPTAHPPTAAFNGLDQEQPPS